MLQRNIYLNILAIISFTLLAGFFVYQYNPGQYPNPSFQLLDGNRTSLHDYRGRPVIILFWATTCPICIQEIPHLSEFYNEFKNKELELIAVAMPYDPPNRVVETREIMKIPFPVAIDIDGQTVDAFGDIILTPTTVIISPEGEIISIESGRLDLSIIRKLVMQYIPAGKINSA